MAAEHQDTFHHVRDFPFFELPETLGIGYRFEYHGHEVFGFELPELLGLQLTRYMVVQVVAGLLTLFIFMGLSRRIRSGEPANGWFWNFWEVIALFIRDEVVRPTIGEGHAHHGDYVNHATDLLPPETPRDEVERFHESPHHSAGESESFGHAADRFLPFIWSCFFYILFCNLLGMIPPVGSPTASISVTAALALCAFGMMLMTGSKAMGVVGFWKNQVPEMGVSGPIKYFLVPLVWLIEVLGLLIKHGVLAVRLFANIMAGHTVLGVLVAFLIGVAGTGLWWPVMAGSVLGQVVVSVLELLFAFIQAYIFAFLTTVFISLAVHPH